MKKVNLKIISSIPPHGFSRRIIVLIAASVPKVFSEKNHTPIIRWGFSMDGLRDPNGARELKEKCHKKLIDFWVVVMYKFYIF